MSLRHGAHPFTGRRALVVFSGRTDFPWLRFLKPGFRHCFVAVKFDGCWVVIEPLSHRTDVAVCEFMTAGQLTNFYLSQGLKVVLTRTKDPGPEPAPWRPFTCVEAVTRILGLRAPAVLTPWQLFRHIIKKRKIILDNRIK